MENVSNISSEDELLQLRNEGKISEAEYQDMLATMRKTTKADFEWPATETDKAKSKRKLGKIAFALMLTGIILPAFFYFMIELLSGPNIRPAIGPPFFLGIVLEIAALGIGIAAWADPFGKAAAVVSLLFLIAVFLFVIGFMPRRFSVVDETLRVTASKTIEINELKRFALDSLEGVITQSSIQFDKQISSDGNGSLRVEVTGPKTIRLYETGDIDIENARLIYQARLRSANVVGKVYLEMCCCFPGGRKFFIKGLVRPVSGTTDWTTEQAPFLLKAGENPDNVKLNLVVDGTGTVWIDDIRLLKAPPE